MNDFMSRIRSQRTTKGQAFLEFIGVLPVALMSLAMVFYVGWLMYAKLAAQNAAYSVTVAEPRAYFQAHGETYIIPEYLQILDDSTGMKSMWEAGFAGDDYLPGFGSSGRLGGYGAIVGIEPSENIFTNFAVFIQNTREGNIPRATSFFLSSPFISARE